MTRYVKKKSLDRGSHRGNRRNAARDRNVGVIMCPYALLASKPFLSFWKPAAWQHLQRNARYETTPKSKCKNFCDDALGTGGTVARKSRKSLNGDGEVLLYA
jgi:hypothetical protein